MIPTAPLPAELLSAYEAVADRIVPDDGWPSASASGALDHLSSLSDAALAVARIEVIRRGLETLEAEAAMRYGRSFAALGAHAQDEMLERVDADSGSADFLEAIVELVALGYYADPANLGNRDGRSWSMIGFQDRLREGGPTQYAPAPPRTDPAALASAYDVIVVGSGAGGGVAALIAAEAGMRVLVIDREEWLDDAEIGTDSLRNQRFTRYGTNAGPPPDGAVRTIVLDSGDEFEVSPLSPLFQNNAATVGGGTRVFGAQAWRFHPDDFAMATRYGVPAGSSLSDWPISYEDLAPHYDWAEWALGVSGDGGAHRGAGPRARGYPMPPMPETKEGARLHDGARRLGWPVGPVPLLINSVPRDGRPACARCAHCVGFSCPVDAKNGSHATSLRRALATGCVDLATGVAALAVGADRPDRVTGVRVAYFSGDTRVERVIAADHVVVACGAVESARLLLSSANGDAPHGLANAGDQVGRHLQGHVYTGAYGRFRDEVQDCTGPGPAIATRHFSHGIEGILGGGMLANDFVKLPVAHFALAQPPGERRWGAAAKAAMRDGYRHTSHVTGPVQEIPLASARVRLSPTRRDRFGAPVAMLSGGSHPATWEAARMLADRAAEWLEAAGAERVWRQPLRDASWLSGGQHQAGTLRMGTDPRTSVVDPTGRVHGLANLWVADGSPHVTNGGVNPVLTILALAHRSIGHLVADG